MQVCFFALHVFVKFSQRWHISDKNSVIMTHLECKRSNHTFCCM